MELGRVLITLGVLLIVIGLVVLLLERGILGHIPGDIVIKGKHWKIFLPLGTSLLLSLLLTLLLNLFLRK